MSAKIYFMDQDTFDLSDAPLAIEVCEFDINKIDIIHSASNPNFTMGGGRDAYLLKEFKFQPTKELELQGKLLSLISVDSNINATKQLVYEAYQRYFKYCMENNKKNIGVIALGCGVGGLTKKQSIEQLFKALLDVFCIGYKAMNSNYECKHLKFEIGKEYTQSGKIKVCENGFHFCPVMNDCFGYYDFSDDTKVCSVIGSGEFDFEKDKVCFENIKIVSEHAWYEVLEMINIGKNNTGRGNTGNRNTGDRNTGNRNTGNRNTGNGNTGDRNTGNRNTGNGNTGDRNTGDRNTGNRNTGNRNTGNRNTGNRNTGNRNTGDRNTGNRNTGNGNTGDRNTGNRNTGDRNTGNRNTGNRNTGNRNTGNGNTGDRNTGNRNTGNGNTGFFMTIKGQDYSFNKKTDIEMYNYPFPSYFRFYTTTWVYESSMTAKEMKEYPTYKTTGGYLKEFEYKEARIKSFEEADKSDVKKTLEIPNFDYKIFEEITGITKKMINAKIK